MNSITEIEAAIEKLPPAQINELARWLETVRARRSTTPLVENWLAQARGAACTGLTTASVLELTRGDK
jgi:hypothetical protein